MLGKRAPIISLAAFFALALGGGSIARALTGPGVIRITERQVQDGRVDLGSVGRYTALCRR